MSRMSFDLLGSDGAARRGRLTFPRGTVETPAFMPVGTYGSVKGIMPEDVSELGAERHTDPRHASEVLGWVARAPEQTIVDTARSLIERGLVRI